MRGLVSRWGNSLALRLPKGIVDDAALKEGAVVNVTVENGAIVVRREHPKFVLDELMAAYKPEHRHDETDWGAPSGKEVW